MVHAYANDKHGDALGTMGEQPRFKRHVVPEASSVVAALLRDVRTGRAIGRVNGDELGEPCDGNPEPSVESGEIALVCTGSMACVETRCHPLPCGYLGDEGIVLPTMNKEIVESETNGASSSKGYHLASLLPARGGVYAIVNVNNGKRYVGSSRNIRARIQVHRSKLRLGKHHSPILQFAWKKHGGNDAFRVEVLEYCDNENKLYGLEQRYMDALQPEYNVGPIAGSRRNEVRNPDIETRRLDAYRRSYEIDKERINSLRSVAMRAHWAVQEHRVRRIQSHVSNPAQLKGARAHHRPDWTPEMDTVLREHYPVEGRLVVARLPVTESAARHRANRLGLRTTRRGGRRRRGSA
jgi:hypothetical protein